MALLLRSSASVAVSFLLAGCSEILGTRDPVDVSVVASVEADETVFFVVRNHSPAAIILDKSPCGSWIQQYTGGEWRYPVRKHPCFSVLILERIEAGTEYTSEKWDLDQWEHGDYRFALPLKEDVADWPSLVDYPEGVELLPEEARTSNSFRVEHVVPLAKASGWRSGLEPPGSPFAVLEIAPHEAAARRAWRENVPDTLAARDGVPDEPGVYGDLNQIDFDQDAIVVWSSGESGTCPDRIVDIRAVEDGTVEVERSRTSSTRLCTDDYRPYRMVLAVDRDRLPDLADLPSEVINGVPDGIVAVYPYEP